MRRTSQFRRALFATFMIATAGWSIACGEVARTGRAPAFLIIEALEADSGADTEDTFTPVLMSDVETVVEVQQGGQTLRVPTRFNDSGRVKLRLALKNPGTATSPLGPTTLNEITVTRYRVEFRRTDGRNTQGVDVPYAFEGGMTITVPASGTAEGTFDVVRHTAKTEPPLRNLAGGGAGIFINTVAEVTFFGRDQAGNETTVSGLLTVNFGDFGDSK
jgi:hypothetical protein